MTANFWNARVVLSTTWELGTDAGAVSISEPDTLVYHF